MRDAAHTTRLGCLSPARIGSVSQVTQYQPTQQPLLLLLLCLAQASACLIYSNLRRLTFSVFLSYLCADMTAGGLVFSLPYGNPIAFLGAIKLTRYVSDRYAKTTKTDRLEQKTQPTTKIGVGCIVSDVTPSFTVSIEFTFKEER